MNFWMIQRPLCFEIPSWQDPLRLINNAGILHVFLDFHISKPQWSAQIKNMDKVSVMTNHETKNFIVLKALAGLLFLNHAGVLGVSRITPQKSNIDTKNCKF